MSMAGENGFSLMQFRVRSAQFHVLGHADGRTLSRWQEPQFKRGHKFLGFRDL